MADNPTPTPHEHSFVLQQGATCRCGVTRAPIQRERDFVAEARTPEEYRRGAGSPAPTPRTKQDALIDDLMQDIGDGIDGEPYLDRAGWERAHDALQRLAILARQAFPAAAAPLEPPRPLYNASGTTANADLPRADSATALPLDVERLAEAIRNVYIASSASRDLDAQNIAAEYAHLSGEPTGEKR